MKNSNALVVGLGSIGQRHLRVLTELGVHVAGVSAHLREADVFSNLDDALSKHDPAYVVVATPTGLHHRALQLLIAIEYPGTILVEKPLVARLSEIPEGIEGLDISVGYNLRFHPAVRAFEDLVRGENIVTATAYAGQYLPDWRPGRDYSSTSSASTAAGGGVLRDLSHELDLLIWLFGTWDWVAGFGGRFSSLDIESDDVWGVMAAFARCRHAMVHLDYLHRDGKRELVAVGEAQTIELDLARKTVIVDGKAERFEVDSDTSYREMHRALLGADRSRVCSLTEGLGVVHFIEAIEEADCTGGRVINQ